MLYFHHSNNLNRLGDRLISLITQSSVDVLEAQTIVVQNPGMKRWLQHSIARKQGIAANIGFPLPSRFVWDVYSQVFDGMDAMREQDAEVMRWRLLKLLKQHVDTPELQLLKAYLRQSDDLPAFQLADRLAHLFDQYQVYRPSMINDWTSGKTSAQDPEYWQAWLWQQLEDLSNGTNRAEMLYQLVKVLGSPDNSSLSALPASIHVFGLSSLSPMYLNVFAALSQVSDVHFHLLNPCRHYWGDIQSLRERLSSDSEDMPEHDLLASLGKQGREFIDQLYSVGVDFDDDPLFEDITQDSLLRQVQHGILELEQSFYSDQSIDDDHDDSIQIVSCYSELRELQVLHDRLLAWLDRDPGLQLDDIVVMCPDIARLSPYIEAVFGDRDSPTYLPFAISDHNPLLDDPLIRSILDWIRLPVSRLSVNEVLGWLELPALQRALNLSESDLEQMRYWVVNNRIHWGADQQHRQQVGQVANHLHSWRFGINRLLASFAMSDEVTVFGEQALSSDLPGQHEFNLLGRVQWFIDQLAAFSRSFARPASMSEWLDRINAMLEIFLRPDEAEENKLKVLRETLAGLQQQTGTAGFEDGLDYRLLHRLLEQSLQQHSAGHQYLGGAINFCNLIPMRSLPFRVICLLGLDDASFPRRESVEQFDIIARKPQKGDRSRREDDRYMFLQSLVSAQDIFYLSYVGREKTDDSEIQPSVLIHELVDHLKVITGRTIAIEQTPLQAFSAETFVRGSYASNWLPKDFSRSRKEANQNLILSAQQLDRLELAELQRFLHNPAKFFMRNHLQLMLEESVAVVEDEDVFELDPLSRYDLARDTFDELLQHGAIEEKRYLKSGRLSPHFAGQLQLDQQLQRIRALVESVSGHQYFEHPMQRELRVQLNDLQLNGHLYSYSGQGLLQVYPARLNARRLLSSWLTHCAGCAAEVTNFSEIAAIDGDSLSWKRFEILEPVTARGYLQELAEIFRLGQQRSLCFFPDAAHRYMSKLRDKGDEAVARAEAEKMWSENNPHAVFESQDAYMRLALKSSEPEREEFFPQEFYELAMRIYTPLMDNLEDMK